MENLENFASVDQRVAAACALLAAHRHLFAHQGVVVASYRSRGARRLGPYYFLRYRLHGRQQAHYLGTSPAAAARVRQLLDRLQAVRREARSMQRIRRAVVASWRAHKQQLHRELICIGRTLKGNELRRLKSASRSLSPQLAPRGTQIAPSLTPPPPDPDESPPSPLRPAC
jgi:hypothetical protein